MQKNTIHPQNIALQISVENWQQAIEKAGELLLASGCIKPQYIQDMINAVKEFGPYIVVAPGIALAHARPSAEVLETAVSLITLAVPIEFGSEENDPVQIVIALCACNNNEHIGLLSQLTSFLDQDTAVPFLMSGQSSTELAEAINSFKQGNT